MAFKINWSEKARNDRKEIFEYWNTRNKSSEYSRKLHQLFKSSINYLVDFPLIGKKSDFSGIRFLIVRDYLIFYNISGSIITILSVRYGGRDPEKLKEHLSL